MLLSSHKATEAIFSELQQFATNMNVQIRSDVISGNGVVVEETTLQGTGKVCVHPSRYPHFVWVSLGLFGPVWFYVDVDEHTCWNEV